jgi:hypothetical protein
VLVPPSRRAAAYGATARSLAVSPIKRAQWPVNRAAGTVLRRLPHRILGLVHVSRTVVSRRRPGSGPGSLEPVRAVDGAVEEEDLGGGVGVDVVGAHEGLDVALGQALDDGHELLAHGVLEGAS